MSSAQQHTIGLTDVGLVWPDGRVALQGITATFETGRTGLAGLNGSGKSTLLRLIAGELSPTSGSISLSGEVDYLPQTLTLEVDSTAGDLLGVRQKIDAFRVIENGDVSQARFDELADDWDIETRAGVALREAGLDGSHLDRRVSELSGGEVILTAIAGLKLRGAPISLLDEPTNNLDTAARSRLADVVRTWKGTLVVVSHDAALLELMDDTAELHDGILSVFGGPYSAFQAHLAQQQSAARQAHRAAQQVLKIEKRQRVEAETKLARRASYANTDYENKRKPRAVMNQRKSQAQVSAGKLRTEFDGKIDNAADSLDAIAVTLRSDSSLDIDLPDPDVPANRRLAELVGTNRTHIVQGPERIALTGPNGVGKTTLLEALVRPATARASRASATAHTSQIGYLTQRLDGFDETNSVLDNVRVKAPSSAPGEIRNRLARFLIRGDAVDRPLHTLSGGERFRVALAGLLLADPPAQLLVLDEPTNNLDSRSVDQLVTALSRYRGGIIVASHDHTFLQRLDITIWLELNEEGNLTELPAPS